MARLDQELVQLPISWFYIQERNEMDEGEIQAFRLTERLSQYFRAYLIYFFFLIKS